MRKRIHHVHSLTFWYSFLSYALITFIIAASVFGYLQYQNLQESRQRTQTENLQRMDSLYASIDGILSNEMVTASRLRTMDWVHRYYVDSPIFNDQFTLSKQRELSGLLQLNSSPDQIEKRIFIIFPYRDTCVSYNIWVSVRDFFGMLRHDSQANDILLDEIKAVRSMSRLKTLTSGRSIERSSDGSGATPVISICIPLEESSQPRAYAVFLIAKDLLTARLSSQLTGALCGLDIVDAVTGETLISLNENKPEDAAELHVRSSSYIEWEYRVYLDPAMYSMVSSVIHTYSLPFAILLFAVCLLLSYGLAYLTYLPLGRLTVHIRGSENPSAMFHDYRLLGKHLDAIRLQQEEERRCNALRNLLTCPLEGDARELEQCGLPFTSQMWYQVYLVTRTEEDLQWQEDLAVEALAIDEAYSSLTCTGLSMDRSTYAIITACASETDALERDHDIQNRIARCGGNIYVGQISTGFVGASIAYQSAHAKRVYSPNGGAKYYLPFEWENQLLTALRTGNEENALLICGNLRKENVRRRDNGQLNRSDMLQLLFILHNDLQRAASESGKQDVLPGGMMTFAGKRTAEIWNEFERVCAQLCRRHIAAASAPDIKDLTTQLIRYTQENYHDHALSLTTLEEVFSISSSTVNKCFKSASGNTFYAFLTRIRMDHACDMLRQGNISIAEIARRCGYENEYSFRRTFQRTQGVKAQDYAGIHTSHTKEDEP